MKRLTREGPQALPVRYTCTGCRFLRLRGWMSCNEDDSVDKWQKALCGKTKQVIAHYWTDNDPPPQWCPFITIEGTPDGHS